MGIASRGATGLFRKKKGFDTARSPANTGSHWWGSPASCRKTQEWWLREKFKPLKSYMSPVENVINDFTEVLSQFHGNWQLFHEPRPLSWNEWLLTVFIKPSSVCCLYLLLIQDSYGFYFIVVTANTDVLPSLLLCSCFCDCWHNHFWLLLSYWLQLVLFLLFENAICAFFFSG
jgi:hypothetical protein